MLEHLRDQALLKDNTVINCIAVTHAQSNKNLSLLISLCPLQISKVLYGTQTLIFKNGSRVKFLSTEMPETLRGKQSHYTFSHRLVTEDVEEQILMHTRLGQNPQVFYYD